MDWKQHLLYVCAENKELKIKTNQKNHYLCVMKKILLLAAVTAVFIPHRGTAQTASGYSSETMNDIQKKINEIDSLIKKDTALHVIYSRQKFNNPIASSKGDSAVYNGFKSDDEWEGCKDFSKAKRKAIMNRIKGIINDTAFSEVDKYMYMRRYVDKEGKRIDLRMHVDFCLKSDSCKMSLDSLAYYLNIPYTCDREWHFYTDNIVVKNDKYFVLIGMSTNDSYGANETYDRIIAILSTVFGEKFFSTWTYGLP